MVLNLTRCWNWVDRHRRVSTVQLRRVRELRSRSMGSNSMVAASEPNPKQSVAQPDLAVEPGLGN